MGFNIFFLCLDKPIFTNPEPSELIGMENEPYIITLQTRGNPGKITYTWTRDGLHLPDRGRRMTARGPTLNITKLERLDSGSYVCEAINDKGATFYHLNLTVQCELLQYSFFSSSLQSFPKEGIFPNISHIWIITILLEQKYKN